MVVINGKEYPYEKKSIEWVLEELGLDASMLIVEHNERILDKSQLFIELKEGDQLELITFLGGG